MVQHSPHLHAQALLVALHRLLPQGSGWAGAGKCWPCKAGHAHLVPLALRDVLLVACNWPWWEESLNHRNQQAPQIRASLTPPPIVKHLPASHHCFPGHVARPPRSRSWLPGGQGGGCRAFGQPQRTSQLCPCTDWFYTSYFSPLIRFLYVLCDLFFLI